MEESEGMLNYNPSAVDSEGITPAHLAAFEGHAAVLVALSKQGANLDLKDKNGDTPLIIAIRGEDCSTCSVLLGLGANPTLPGIAGILKHSKKE